jgi:hypothetical protein
VKYPEVVDRQQKSPELLQMDLPEIGAPAPIFLQIQVGDSLESEAVILCCSR